MKRAVWLYTHLLRLYPPSFRAEYAEEMSEVFAAAVAETDDVFGVVSLCAGELRDLPGSILREHLYERRQAVLAKGANMMMTPIPIRTVRWSAIGNLGILAAYALLIVLPFFAFGLHNQPVAAVRGGLFDPKGLPIYSGDQLAPNLLFIFTLLMMLIAPVWQMVWGSVLALTLLRHWRGLTSKQRWLGGAGLAASLGFLAFIASPLGSLIMTWLAD